MSSSVGFEPYRRPLAARSARLNRPLKQLTWGLKEVFQRGIQPELRIQGADWRSRIPLGSGSFATVYGLRNCSLAVKVNEAEVFAYAKHEEWALTRWQKVPFIIKFYGSFYLSKNKKALVMDKVSQTLDDLLEKQALTSGQSFLLAKQLLKMAKVLALQNEVHADLSFRNLSFDNNRLTVFDLGFTHFISNEPKKIRPHAIQSVLVRAPEICLGRQYDCSIDWWSIGAIFFRVYTGRHFIDVTTPNPFNGEEILLQMRDRIGPLPDAWGVELSEKERIRLLSLDEELERACREKQVPKEIHRLAARLMKGLLAYENRLSPEQGIAILDDLKKELDRSASKRLKTA